jgi:hypothetical protein
MDLLERAPVPEELDGALGTTTGGRVALLAGEVGLEGEQLGVPGHALQCGSQLVVGLRSCVIVASG